METDNTKLAFYALWSREQLIAELVRINELLNEINAGLLEVSKTLEAKP